jgi:peptide/nickel transport system ATP-binding protein
MSTMQELHDPKTAPTAENTLVEVRDLKKHFPIQRGLLKKTVGHIRAVDGVSIAIDKSQTHGLVGESGSGKTTLGRMIIRAIDPTDGDIWFNDRDVGWTNVAQSDDRRLRMVRRNMKIVYQDPYSSLNPRMTVQQIVGEHLRVNRKATGKQLDRQVEELLDLVGLRPEYGRRYPHAFSGGQRQRIAIARALSMRPQLLICDEPVSALDVSVQAQILKLLSNLQQQFGLSYLFVAHDLSVVENVSNHVSVMYVGQIVESAPKEELYQRPLHPYTEALMSAVPQPDPRVKKQRIVLKGELPSPENPPAGCYFHPRCRYAQDICRTDAPALREIRPGHTARCHFAGELDLQGAVIAQPAERQSFPQTESSTIVQPTGEALTSNQPLT